MKCIRKNVEQEFVKSLTRFHYREIDRQRVEIKRSKRLKGHTAGNSNNKSVAARSAGM